MTSETFRSKQHQILKLDLKGELDRGCCGLGRHSARYSGLVWKGPGPQFLWSSHSNMAFVKRNREILGWAWMSIHMPCWMRMVLSLLVLWFCLIFWQLFPIGKAAPYLFCKCMSGSKCPPQMDGLVLLIRITHFWVYWYLSFRFVPWRRPIPGIFLSCGCVETQFWQNPQMIVAMNCLWGIYDDSPLEFRGFFVIYIDLRSFGEAELLGPPRWRPTLHIVPPNIPTRKRHESATFDGLLGRNWGNSMKFGLILGMDQWIVIHWWLGLYELAVHPMQLDHVSHKGPPVFWIGCSLCQFF